MHSQPSTTEKIAMSLIGTASNTANTQPFLQAPISKRAKPSLEPIFTRLRFKLLPIQPMPEGAPHPAFPATLLEYHLLCEETLDSLARFYHQNPVSPSIWTYSYPAYMDLDPAFLNHVGEMQGSEARIAIKRRKFGRFIGLKGCDTPVEEVDERGRWEQRRRRMEMKTDHMVWRSW